MSYILRRRKLGRTSCREIAAKSDGLLQVIRNDEMALPDFPYRYVFRWGTTSSLSLCRLRPTEGEVNTAESIRWCANKRESRLTMQEAGVSVPRTWAMEDWLHEVAAEELDTNAERFVMRPETHAQGRALISGSVSEIVESYDARFSEGYVSELVNKVAEYRIAVIQNRVAWVARKTPGNPEDVAWNVARGGRFDNVRWADWPMEVIRQALHAARVSGTDFCGVDVMVDAEGRAFVLEVNSAPSQTSAYRQGCFAKCFSYIVTHGKEHFLTPERITSWKHVIHPAINSRSTPE